MDDRQPVSRRLFLGAGAATFTAGTLAVCGQNIGGNFARFLGGSQNPHVPPLCRNLVATHDEATGLELLKLPAGFRYVSFGWAGDPLADGSPTPGVHDGMAVIAENDGKLILCRNHEVTGDAPSIGSAEITFDPYGAAGCTHLTFDTQTGRFTEAWTSLAGTVRNCAGGPTPWGSWLSAEETVLSAGDTENGRPLRYQHDHGWVFEVPAHGPAEPVPLKAMGRFVHEAVAVDPATGIVYETEDRPTCGFYRFLPREKGRLAAGGELQMMKVRLHDDLSRGSPTARRFDVEWVPIEDPLRPHNPGTRDEHGVFSQGKSQAATTFARLEGCWYGGGSIYFVSTSGGRAAEGQVWRYDPAHEQLHLVFESPSARVLDNPDNMAVHPRGWIVLCEDGQSPPRRLQCLTPAGNLFPIAENNIVLRGERNGFRGNFRDQEWAGACFSPDGEWLFANIQNPGLTVAITGPWAECGL